MTFSPQPAELEDATAIRSLLDAAFADYVKRLLGRQTSNPRDWVEAAIAEKSIFVVRLGGNLAALVKFTDAPSEDAMTLDYLAVAPTHARQGIGSALLDWFDGHARAAGRGTVRLHTAEIMTHLVALYHRHGYRTERVGPPPHGQDSHPRVFMQKRLDVSNGN